MCLAPPITQSKQNGRNAAKEKTLSNDNLTSARFRSLAPRPKRQRSKHTTTGNAGVGRQGDVRLGFGTDTADPESGSLSVTAWVHLLLESWAATIT